MVDDKEGNTMTDQELALAYAPILLFSAGEQFFPMDADKYIEKCSLHLRESDTEERMLLPPGNVMFDWWVGNDNVNTSQLFLTYADRRGTSRQLQETLIELWKPRYLEAVSIPAEAPVEAEMMLFGAWRDLKETLADLVESAENVVENALDAVLDHIDGTTAYQSLLHGLKKNVGCQVYPEKVYRRACTQYLESQSKLTYTYRVVSDKGGYDKIAQYWYFYAFNPHINRHEADWESVTIFFRNGKPERAVYSAHDGGNPYEWHQLSRITDRQTGCERPLVYVAKDSHANYRSVACVADESGLIKTKGGERMSCDEFEPGGVIVGDLSDEDFQDAVLAGQPFHAHQTWDPPQELVDSLAWMDFNGVWGVNVRHSGNQLPDDLGEVDDCPEQPDHTVMEWMEKVIGEARLAELMQRLGGAPVGPKRHNDHGQWDDPSKLLHLT
jgi:hypothetical protein